MTALRIGLTGGIGSGKSTVANRLAELGAAVVDTDFIARRLSEPGGAAVDAIRASFGAEVIDSTGALDRARMRGIVFADVDAKRRLEAILHPLIGAQARQQALTHAGHSVVFDVPLLVESRTPQGWRSRVDRVLVVDCSQATQVARVSQRPGWTPDAALCVIAQQASRQARRAVADAVIFNDGDMTLDKLALEVGALWTLWDGH